MFPPASACDRLRATSRVCCRASSQYRMDSTQQCKSRHLIKLLLSSTYLTAAKHLLLVHGLPIPFLHGEFRNQIFFVKRFFSATFNMSLLCRHGSSFVCLFRTFAKLSASSCVKMPYSLNEPMPASLARTATFGIRHRVRPCFLLRTTTVSLLPHLNGSFTTFPWLHYCHLQWISLSTLEPP